MSEQGQSDPVVHPSCAICNAKEQLVKDRDNQGVFYCHSCYHRSQEHEFLIKALGMKSESVAGD